MLSNRLRELRERAGLSMQALAERIGTSAPQINKLEKGERRMTIDWMTRLARGLGCEPGDLLPNPPIAFGGQAIATMAETPVVALRPLGGDPRDMIPVRSAARGGGEQEMFLQDGPIDYMRRPHSLLHVRDAYSIYMVGDFMNPRYRQGQLLHINPYKPPQTGAGVVVTKTNDAVLIKEFVRRGAATLYVRQYNPQTEIEIALDEVRDLHTVVGSDEP